MGYRGKTTEQNRARELRVQGWTIKEIAAELSVSQSSVSNWVRDVVVDAETWARRVSTRTNHGWEKRRQTFLRRAARRAQELRNESDRIVGKLSDRDLLIAGVALYAAEGSKTPGAVMLPNSDPRVIAFFLEWLRRSFVIDESRLRVRIYLHKGLDLAAAERFWSELTGIPASQFTKPYRAEPDPTIRKTKHVMGCPRVAYSCTDTHRRIMSLVDSLLSCTLSNPG